MNNGMQPFHHEGASNAPQTGAQLEQSRATKEVEAQVVMAKKFPRDETASYNRIMRACERLTLAEQAIYSYKRGNEVVTGASIRLAEVLARNWGNLKCGVRELSQENGTSVAQAYAWDLETNFFDDKVFTVPHKRVVREKKNGQFTGGYIEKELRDPRDIYELVANYGARRKRACLLAAIPGDIVEAAVRQCEQTLAKGDGTPLVDRIRNMVHAFDEIQVTQGMLEQFLGHKIEITSETELVKLKGVYRSIRDGISGREQFFDIPGATASVAQEKAQSLDEKLAARKAAPKAEAPAEPSAATTAPPNDGRPTYAEIAEQIKAAQSTDDVDVALDLVRDLPEDQANELRDAATSRKSQLNGNDRAQAAG